MSEIAFLIVGGAVAWFVFAMEREGRLKAAASKLEREEHYRSIEETRLRHIKALNEADRRVLAAEEEASRLRRQSPYTEV